MVGGGQILMAHDLIREILAKLRLKSIASEIVPERFALLRVLHLVAQFERNLFDQAEGDLRKILLPS